MWFVAGRNVSFLNRPSPQSNPSNQATRYIALTLVCPLTTLPRPLATAAARAPLVKTVPPWATYRPQHLPGHSPCPLPSHVSQLRLPRVIVLAKHHHRGIPLQRRPRIQEKVDVVQVRSVRVGCLLPDEVTLPVFYRLLVVRGRGHGLGGPVRVVHALRPWKEYLGGRAG